MPSTLNIAQINSTRIKMKKLKKLTHTEKKVAHEKRHFIILPPLALARKLSEKGKRDVCVF